MKLRRPLVALALAIALSSASGRTQDAPPPPAPPAGQSGEAEAQQRPVFRAGATFVRVDVYPRRDGQVIPGLSAEDFTVTEDDKPQAVETFEFIEFAANTPDAERRDPNSFSDSERQAADPRNRVFVVYLDVFHLSFAAANEVRAPVLNFLNRAIGPTDLFAALTPELPVSRMVFGRRTDTIAADLSRIWSQIDAGSMTVPRTEFESRLKSCGASDEVLRVHREDLLFTSLENLTIRLGALKDERKNVLFVSEGFVPRPMGAGVPAGGGGGLPGIGVGPTGRLGIGNQQPYGRDDSWCGQQFGRLAAIDFEQRFRDLLREAVRANVTFYPIDVGGLKVGLAIADASVRSAADARFRDQARLGARAIDALRTLAENTDGIAVVNTNDLTAGVRRIADNLSSHYVLGYYSTNSATDGKFREIKVRVNRPGVSVAARRGYYALTTAIAAAASAPSAPATPSAVDEELGRLARIRDDAELYGIGAAVPGRLDVVAELASRQLALGRWKTGASVAVNVSGAGSSRLTGTGRIEPGRRSALVSIALPQGASGPYRVSVRVSGADGELEDRFEVAPAGETRLGAPLIFRGLPSPRAPLRPAADFQFRRNERLRIEWPVLTPAPDRTARVLDRTGSPLAVPPIVGERNDEGGARVTADVVMSAFSEGDYVVELTAGQGDDRDRELVAFRVVR